MTNEKETLERIKFFDELAKAWHESLKNAEKMFRTPLIDPVEFISDGTQWFIAPKGCDHKWVKYQGFTDSYDYCEICDEKKEKA